MSRPNISNISKPPIRPPFIPRTIINQRVVDPSIIAKLFLICQEGVISNIKNYIISKGLNANDLVNTDGQSILHVILLNDSITPREKTDIFKFLASRNLLKFSYDSQQKTPLHIASEKQLTDIVKILLGASHDINALDSTKRTPIYYAIVGTEVDCPKKEKKLIEKKKTIKLNIQDELNEEIVNFINGNAEIKNLLLHIYNTTKNLDSIYNDEITKILEDDNKKIMEILVTEKETILNEFLSKITFFSDWTEIPEGNQIKMMNTKDKN
jgi:ankyrin repeat protein